MVERCWCLIHIRCQGELHSLFVKFLNVTWDGLLCFESVIKLTMPACQVSEAGGLRWGSDSCKQINCTGKWVTWGPDFNLIEENQTGLCSVVCVRKLQLVHKNLGCQSEQKQQEMLYAVQIISYVNINAFFREKLEANILGIHPSWI